MDFPSYKALMSNLSLAILVSKSFRILHLYTVKGFPSSANTKSEVSSIFELISRVGRPSCLRWGSREWANLAKVSKPLWRMMVSVATVPPVANSGYSKALKINLHYYSDLLVKKRATWPFNKSESLYELGLKLFSSSVPRAILRTPFLPIMNLLSVCSYLRPLKLFVDMLSNESTYRFLNFFMKE
jgi:hypothetical protein